MPEIEVARDASADDEPMRFLVSITDDGSSTEHHVTVSAADLERLRGSRSPEAFVHACFAYLLEREPKESILPAFDVAVIGHYFPGFEDAISRAT